MTKKTEATPAGTSFYVGYSNTVARPLALFLIPIAALVLVIFAGTAFLVSRNSNDPGNGDYDADVTLHGTVIAQPAPVLRIPTDDRHPQPHAILLAGDGKFGVAPQAAALAGKSVTIAGTILRRGSIDMLVASPQSIQPAAADTAHLAAPVSLGRWRLSGEICDGKCNTGAMRPGNGLAHKACANLCVAGGVPPVFVSTGPVEGQAFFLLTGKDGAALPANLYDWVALRITLEGNIIKLDDLLILQADLATAHRQ
jgi:hypothetical protein